MKKEKVFFEGYDKKIIVSEGHLSIRNKLYSIADIKSAEFEILHFGDRFRKVIDFIKRHTILILLIFILLTILVNPFLFIVAALIFAIRTLFLSNPSRYSGNNIFQLHILYRNGEVSKFNTTDAVYAKGAIEGINRAIKEHEKKFHTPPSLSEISPVETLSNIGEDESTVAIIIPRNTGERTREIYYTIDNSVLEDTLGKNEIEDLDSDFTS